MMISPWPPVPPVPGPVPVPPGWQIEKERPYGDTLLVVAIA